MKVPGRKPNVCHSLVELLDLFPTTARLCGLEVPARLQGSDISPMFDDPQHSVRNMAFSVAPSSKGFLLRNDEWAYIQYAEDASRGVELYDVVKDPKQYTNLAVQTEYSHVVESFKETLAAKLSTIRNNDLTKN
jgi:iduronate 2-sulfatase